jgi:hypothetical protein
MKSYINKLFSALCLLLLVGMTSCTGDLDMTPNDPNTLTSDKFSSDPATYLAENLAKCYSGMAVSGQGGPNGNSDISGLDGGTGQYTRTLFMMNEFTTDESKWIWARNDQGVLGLVIDNWGADNACIYGTYCRLYVHIAICNEFLRLANSMSVSDDMKATVEQYKLEARALRAYSYYNVIDLFGSGGFIDETSASGTSPKQMSRTDLYNWLVKELTDIDASMSDATPVYGRVGKDGVEGLLARTYLNAGVYTGTNAYDKCAEVCQKIIARHQGGGFTASDGTGTGLAKHYLYLFCGDNNEYMPGGGNTAENEILWGIPYDSQYIEPWGGTMFLCAANVSNLSWKDNNASMDMLNYGMNAQWGCMHATPQFSDKFGTNDIRCSMWCKEDSGFSKDNTDFQKFTDGYGVVKFTNLLKGTDGGWSTENGGKYDPTGATAARAENFPDTDLPLIRLADVYLMYAESYIMGGAGDATTALKYANYVRERAGVSDWTASNLTADNILDERCRELYWENVRRPDLIRHGKFTGSSYLWDWKNNVLTGASIGAYRNLFPIPTNVIAVQPDFVQNPGY